MLKTDEFFDKWDVRSAVTIHEPLKNPSKYPDFFGGLPAAEKTAERKTAEHIISPQKPPNKFGGSAVNRRINLH